jgi:hypothetical protein
MIKKDLMEDRATQARNLHHITVTSYYLGKKTSAYFYRASLISDECKENQALTKSVRDLSKGLSRRPCRQFHLQHVRIF